MHLKHPPPLTEAETSTDKIEGTFRQAVESPQHSSLAIGLSVSLCLRIFNPLRRISDFLLKSLQAPMPGL